MRHTFTVTPKPSTMYVFHLLLSIDLVLIIYRTSEALFSPKRKATESARL